MKEEKKMTTEQLMHILSRIKLKCFNSDYCSKCPFHIELKISGNERGCQFTMLGYEFSEIPCDWNLLKIEEILNETN